MSAARQCAPAGRHAPFSVLSLSIMSPRPTLPFDLWLAQLSDDARRLNRRDLIAYIPDEVLSEWHLAGHAPSVAAIIAGVGGMGDTAA